MVERFVVTVRVFVAFLIVSVDGDTVGVDIAYFFSVEVVFLLPRLVPL